MRYPATIAGLIGLVGIVVAAALFLSSDAEGTQRFSTVVGLVSIAVITLANNLRTDSAAATSQEVKATVDAAIEQGAPQSLAQLEALTHLVEATRQARATAATLERVSNGHSSGDIQTREGDQP